MQELSHRNEINDLDPRLAGVEGLRNPFDFNRCDARGAKNRPAKTRENPNDCRTKGAVMAEPKSPAAVHAEFKRWCDQQAIAGWGNPKIERAAIRLRCAIWERANNKHRTKSESDDLAASAREFMNHVRQ
jgi:hypothetical protein